MPEMPERYSDAREPFGKWLVNRPERRDWTDNLVKMVKVDRGFPKNGDVETVRKYLAERGADGDVFEQLDDAELDYLTH